MQYFTQPMNVAVIGASGAIGRALVTALAAHENVNTVYAFARQPVSFSGIVGVKKIRPVLVDPLCVDSLAAGVSHVEQPLDIVLVTTGLLHQGMLQPEKRLSDISSDDFLQVMQVNALLPMLVARAFLPLFRSGSHSVFAALSARVGSISDNRLGGWYSYRASKAALNMLLKNMAIEVRRSRPEMVVCGLHPGTVDSGLSGPFQRNVPAGKLFTAEFAAAALLEVIGQLQAHDSGRVFAWDGQPVEA